MSLTRTGNQYKCSGIEGATTHSTSGNTNSLPATLRATVAVYGSNATVQWMMVVSSP
jgi:hypothetical protein